MALENLLDFVQILQEELVKAGVLPANFNFETHKELVPMQPDDMTTMYVNATALEHDFACFKPFLLFLLFLSPFPCNLHALL